MKFAVPGSGYPPQLGLTGLVQEELEFSEAQHGPADPRTQQSRTWLADIWLKQGNAVRTSLTCCWVPLARSNTDAGTA